MRGIVNFAIINGDRYLDGIKRHLDGLKLEFYNEYEIYNCKFPQHKDFMTFIINKNEAYSVVQIETEQSISLFNVHENLIEDFIFGIIASCLEICCGGLACITDSVLHKNTPRRGDFYLTNMNDKISISGKKEVFILVEGNCGTGLLDVNRYIEKLEYILDDDSVIISNFIVNVEMEIYSKEKVYLYVKDKL